MYTKNTFTSRVLTFGFVLLIFLILCACSSQQIIISTTPPSTQMSPTQLPPTMVPPSPTSVPSTSTPEPPVLVTSMDEILGEWLSRCGGGPCTFKISADGTYNMRYINPTEGQGVTQIDRGKITFSDGVFHLESTSGYCSEMAGPHGFYKASLKYIDGQLYLKLDGTQDDECGDRQSAIPREMKHYGE